VGSKICKSNSIEKTNKVMGGDLLMTHDFEDWLKQEYNVKYMDLKK
jgi:hypothetical protein